MNVLLINPPLGPFDSIYGAAPTLFGQLKANNIDAKLVDLNVQFYKYITSPEYLKYTKEKLMEIYNDINIINDGVDDKYCLSDEQKAILKEKIEKYLFKNEKHIDRFINAKNSFYDFFLKASSSCLFLESEDNQEKYINLFYFIASFAFLPFYPEKLFVRKVGSFVLFLPQKTLYKYVYEDILDKCSNNKRNIYIDFFEKKIKELNLNEFDVIAITIPFEQNLYPGLTFAKLLKENTKAKVVIGGLQPTVNIDSYMKHSDMFGTFFDHILTGEGEKSIVDYVRYVENKIPISQVSGLVYKQGKEIIKNEIKPIENIKEIHPPCFDGINFDDYTSKYISLEFAKGCYWHKCTFCYNNLWKKYYVKNPVEAVDIIQNLKEKYKINTFNIIDDALNINFAEKFADEIIKRNLKIEYYCFLRMEDGLSYNILKKIKDSGNIGIFLGIESASERILKLMNKGIKLETAKKILKYCHKLDIKTTVGFIFGFPTETEEDIMQTINFIKENRENMTMPANYIFHITKSSAMLTMENRELLQIKNVVQPEEFSDSILYTAPCISKERIYDLLKENELDYIKFDTLV